MGPDPEELKRRCNNCRVSNPLICRETCEVWELRSTQRSLRKEIPGQPNRSTITSAARNPENFKFLKRLSQGRMKTQTKPEESEDCAKELLQAGLVFLHKNTYKLTSAGEKVLETLSAYPLEHSEKTDALDETVLTLLLGGTNTFESLSQTIPRTELMIALKRLNASGLLTQTSSQGDILYFTTKRRPTRQLLPTELKVFKGIPKDGITARELSKKLGLTRPATYRYLRRLRYRRHVVRKTQKLTFGLTPKGRQIAQFLTATSKTVGDLAASDFA